MEEVGSGVVLCSCFSVSDVNSCVPFPFWVARQFREHMDDGILLPVHMYDGEALAASS